MFLCFYQRLEKWLEVVEYNKNCTLNDTGLNYYQKFPLLGQFRTKYIKQNKGILSSVS